MENPSPISPTNPANTPCTSVTKVAPGQREKSTWGLRRPTTTRPSGRPTPRRSAIPTSALNYWYVDLKDRTPVRVDTDLFVNLSINNDPPRGGLQFAWSPDSRWIAYIKQLESYLHAVFVYSIERGQSYQLTDGMSDALHVAFDRRGQYLYFTASTDVGLSTGWDMTAHRRPVTRGVYAMVLTKTLPHPWPLRMTRENDQTTPEKTSTAGIDLDDIVKRIVRAARSRARLSQSLCGQPGHPLSPRGATGGRN